MLPSNRISGTKIAAGRATWVVDDKTGEGFYNFVDSGSFKWLLNPDQLLGLEIDEQDLLDCVEQAEEQFGAPEDYRPAMGLFPDVGSTNIGVTYKSKSNETVICVFTPASIQKQTAGIALSAPIDAYFEWYYQEKSALKPEENFLDFIAYFDATTGNRASEIKKSPIVPGYHEACETSAGAMGDVERERFLSNVWNYHKNVERGYKEQLGREIKETWVRVQRVKSALAVYEDDEASGT